MLKARNWVGVAAAPILLASVGCSMSLQPFSKSYAKLPPERLMSMARTFERQGHLAQAKNAYQQLLTIQPDYPNARRNLDTLIANETNRNGNGNGNDLPSNQSNPSLPGSAQVQIVASEPTRPAPKSANAAPATRIAASLPQLPSIPQTSVAANSTRTINTDRDFEETIPESTESNSLADSASLRESKTDAESMSDVDSTESVAVAEHDISVPEESIEFYQPSRIQQQVEIDDAGQLLGPFRVEMVRHLKANRERFQPQLIEIVANREAESDLRSRAVFLLGAIGPDAIESVPTLRREMHGDVDGFLKVDLSESILKIQPEDGDAIEVLISCLKNSEQEVKHVAAFALRNSVSPRTTFVIIALREALQTDDQKLRRMVFLTLAEFGPAAAEAIPELESALESPDSATREVARTSLAAIAPDRVPAKIQTTSHRSRHILSD